jgi:hypothetical protein
MFEASPAGIPLRAGPREVVERDGFVFADLLLASG